MGKPTDAVPRIRLMDAVMDKKNISSPNPIWAALNNSE
jgi:hypothetical protein